MSNMLAYLVYGSETFAKEAVFSIVSFMKHYPARNVTIVVYTDLASFFRPVLELYGNYEIIPVGRELIDRWKGPSGFVFRAKVEMLRDLCSRREGTAMYLDSDTWFMSDITGCFNSITPRTFLMHCREGHCGTSTGRIERIFRKRIGPHRQALRGHADFNFDFYIWNAGVIGFTTGSARLMDEALFLTDDLYALYPKFISEQFAFSYLFAKHGEIRPAEQSIYHYWDFKEFRSVLDALFDGYPISRGPEQLVRESANISPVEFNQPKLAWKRHSSVYRRLRKLFTGKTWEMPPFKVSPH